MSYKEWEEMRKKYKEWEEMMKEELEFFDKFPKLAQLTINEIAKRLKGMQNV